MDFNDGGSNSTNQHKTAAEIAREKVLAVYSSTVESLKKSNATNSTNSYTEQRDGNQYIAPPVPGSVYSDQDDFVNSNTSNYNNYSDYNNYGYSQINYEPTDSDQRPIESNSTYQMSDETSALKDLPVNQTAVDESWQQYHSAWQNYYQNYYSDYYAKAAQNYLETEKLKSERIAKGEVQRKRNFKRLIPIFVVASVILVFLFLQYNRLLFAPIMAYVAPNSNTAATSIEAVDPTITQAVSPEPRLIIPKLNIDVPVAFGIPNDEVMSAMNHGVAQFAIPGANAMPGEIGNLVLSGHSAGDIYSSNPYKFIFSGLERLEVGDLIYVNYESVRYTYQMAKREVVEPTNITALIYTTTKPMLTLITCTPLGTSDYRLLITAEQINPAPTEIAAEDPEEGGGDEGLSWTTPDNTEMPANEPSFFERIFGD